ncbi:MAG: ABC transporter ATP-binding protein [Candidatus Pacebacteria bacterium]|nr:ABC transporter ATP-binding protein [Candidatus Paceibacterota bacterium]
MKKENTQIKNRNLNFWQILSKLKDIYKPFLGVIITILFLLIIQEILNLLGPYIYGKIIDGIIARDDIYQVLLLCLYAFLVFIISDVIIAYHKEKIEIQKFDMDISKKVANFTMERVFKFSIGQHENQNSGIKKSVIDRGQTALINFGYNLIYEVIPIFLQLFVTIIGLLIVAPIFGIIILIGTSVFIWISIYSNLAIGEDLKKTQDLYVESDKQQSEFLRNASLIKINAKEKKISEEYDYSYEKINKLSKKVWLTFASFVQKRSLIADITKFIILLTGVYLVYSGIYTPGFLMVLYTWSFRVFDRMGYLTSIHRRVTQQYESIKNYFILMEIETDIKEKDNPIIIDDIKGKIEFKNVYFRYSSREEFDDDGTLEIKKEKNREHILKGINLTIKAGQRVAIVGHSGAGKSTLINLLVRAYDPQKGKILIDDNDLKDLSLLDYRSKIGIVPQDVSLFDNTLRYNILFGTNENIEDVQLRESLEMARIDGFLNNLENGVDTFVGEKGIKLSGGERQRVGIARALIKNPSILIFDEATSSLDVENESMIRESIEKASRGRTTIIIAHRLSTIKDADKIIVLEKGKVVGEGTHNYLLKNCEEYKKMINIQTVIVGGS